MDDFYFLIDNYGQEYDALCWNIGEDAAFQRYANQKGKYILVEARENNTTRLFIQSLFDMENVERKSGWWNTFTICDEPQKAGFYIAEVVNVRKDKNGYPNFIASPSVKLDLADILEANSIWEKSKRRRAMMAMLLESDLFTEHYPQWISGQGFNLSALKCRFGMVTTRYSYKDACSRAIGEVICGAADIKELVDLLLSPTQEELARQRRLETFTNFFNDRASHADEYPNLIKKLNRMVELNGEFSVRSDIVNIMDGFYLKYENEAYYGSKMEPINGDIFDRAEAYLKFDAERKVQKSKSRAADKKAKKRAAKEAKASNP